MKHPFRPIPHLCVGIACTIFLASLTAGCRPVADANETRESTTNTPQATPVKLATVQTKEVTRSIVQPATVHAYYETAIYSRAVGFVSELRVDLGDRVTVNQTLAQLAVPELESELKSHEARLEFLTAQAQQATAEIEAMKAHVRAAESQVDQAKAEITKALAMVEAASAEHLRISELVQRGAVQSRLLDEAKQRLDAAEAGHQAALGIVQASLADIDVAKANEVVSEAKLKASEAEFQVVAHQRDTVKTAIGFATIEAPFAGTIIERHVDLGDLVRGESSGEKTPLFVLSQTDRVRIRVAIPEREAPHITLGSPLSLTFPSFADEPPLTASVTRISGNIDPSTRTMMIEAEVENPEGKLLPGMFGEARIEITQQSEANILPASAVRFDEKGNAFVYRVSDDSCIEIVSVTLGFDTGTEIEVTSGVEAGQRVVDAHLKRFAEGLRVTPL